MAVLTGYINAELVKVEAAPTTGSSVTIQTPYNWLLLTNAATLAALTIVLPSAPVDDQLVSISNPSTPVTALTFSPAVLGFANASALAGSAGINLGYSAALGQWFAANI
jgi:hypothetical protein